MESALIPALRAQVGMSRRRGTMPCCVCGSLRRRGQGLRERVKQLRGRLSGLGGRRRRSPAAGSDSRTRATPGGQDSSHVSNSSTRASTLAVGWEWWLDRSAVAGGYPRLGGGRTWGFGYRSFVNAWGMIFSKM